MFNKIGRDTDIKINSVNAGDIKDQLASPSVMARLEKFAKTAQSIGPRSDDFLYFSIIFMKAAESSLLDERGELKIVKGEKAWGYFDENWKWHGNVDFHKNSNSDIFPEIELKKAHKAWIGKPLCVNHESDTVDGVRGIILDTYYDERHKQIVGLCALDKVNYPDLARKIQSGIVRYGSMGTAVEIAICPECGKKCYSQSDYCDDLKLKKARGEINIGLRPIEYSLVVTPAEPAAVLIKCIASIKENKKEIESYGIDSVKLASLLDETKASELDNILNMACGENGCTLDERSRIVKAFMLNNGFNKTASLKKKGTLASEISDISDTLGEKLTADNYKKFADLISEEYKRQFETFVNDSLLPDQQSTITNIERPQSDDLYYETKNIPEMSQSGQDLTGLSGSMGISGPNIVDSETNTFIDNGATKASGISDSLASLIAKHSIKKMSEEIMDEVKKQKRDELRKRIAYHFGGAEGKVEPDTFKSEDQKKFINSDKHMHQDGSMGGETGMFPADKKVKEMHSRAEDSKESVTKTAYHFGGAEGKVEPSTYKSEDYKKYWNSDKQMHQTKSMGGEKEMFPGDSQVKKQLFRTAAYNGPALSTKFKQARTSDGSINKEASCLEVYSGDKLVIAATAKDIFGTKLAENWSWLTSKDYAKAVVSEIREKGIDYVGSLLTKSAQVLPEVPAEAPAEVAAPEAAPAAGAEPFELPEMAPDMGEKSMDPQPEPKEKVESALVDMESKIEEVREAVTQMAGTDGVDVNVNIGEPKESEKVALSRRIMEQLKVSLAEATDSADELALLSETYDNYEKLSATNKRELNSVANDALTEAITVIAQADTLVKMAKVAVASSKKSMEKVATDRSLALKKLAAQKQAAEERELIKEALRLRKERREGMLKKAQEAVVSEAKDSEKTMEVKTVEIIADKVVVKEESKKEEAKEEKKADDMMTSQASVVKSKLAETFVAKKSSEEQEAYRVRLRRAYDLGMEMQKKALLAPTKPALDKQVDLLMEFDERSFEAFKRTVASVKEQENVKIASLGELNVGVTEEPQQLEKKASKTDAATLAKILW